MNLHAIAVGVHWPGRVLRRLRQGKFGLQGLSKSAAVSVDLRGDRDVEWSWVASRLPAGPGEALDFGPGGSHLALVAVQKGFRVTAVDLQPVTWRYTHAGLRFVQGDFLKMSFPKHMFDLVINCSTVEHVGLAGRYGVRHPRPDGDLEAMTYLRTVLKPGGCMVLTIPVGRDTVVGSLHRVYGSQRLERLLHGYLIEDQQYWTKNAQNEWALVDRAAALMVDPLARAYALGCFVLRT